MVSHPLNANPFPGSLLDYRARLRLHEITVDNKTFLQLECSFETEYEVRTNMAFLACCRKVGAGMRKGVCATL